MCYCSYFTLCFVFAHFNIILLFRKVYIFCTHILYFCINIYLTLLYNIKVQLCHTKAISYKSHVIQSLPYIITPVTTSVVVTTTIISAIKLTTVLFFLPSSTSVLSVDCHLCNVHCFHFHHLFRQNSVTFFCFPLFSPSYIILSIFILSFKKNVT